MSNIPCYVEGGIEGLRNWAIILGIIAIIILFFGIFFLIQNFVKKKKCNKLLRR